MKEGCCKKKGKLGSFMNEYTVVIHLQRNTQLNQVHKLYATVYVDESNRSNNLGTLY